MTVPRLIFCLTTGRSGTAYLTEMMSAVPGVSAHHEPEPPFEDWTRRAMTGESCAEFWTESKLPEIWRLAGDAQVYVETSHVFKYLAESLLDACLLYTSPSPRDATLSRMPSSA